MTEPSSTSAPATAANDAPTCGYPGCERPPRAASAGGRGAKPKYCDLADETGKELHTALSAFRARARPGRAEPEDFGRPVALATASASRLRDELRADITALTDK